MAAPDKPNPVANDVLHSQGNSKLTTAEIAKAVARHKRDHPDKAKGKMAQPRKATPRG